MVDEAIHLNDEWIIVDAGEWSEISESTPPEADIWVAISAESSTSWTAISTQQPLDEWVEVTP